MNHIMSFERSKSVEYYKCPICGYETKRYPLVIEQVKTNINEVYNATKEV